MAGLAWMACLGVVGLGRSSVVYLLSWGWRLVRMGRMAWESRIFPSSAKRCLTEAADRRTSGARNASTNGGLSRPSQSRRCSLGCRWPREPTLLAMTKRGCGHGHGGDCGRGSQAPPQANEPGRQLDRKVRRRATITKPTPLFVAH